MVLKLQPSQVPAVTDEVAKAKAFLALGDFFGQHPVANVAFALNPAGLFTTKAIAKAKAIKLVPYGTVAKPKAITATGHYMDQGATKWQIHPFQAPQDFDQPKEGSSLVPFWWCKCTPDQDQANMELHQMSFQGYKVHVLTNSEPVEANTKLQWLKPGVPKRNEPSTDQGANANEGSKKRKR